MKNLLLAMFLAFLAQLALADVSVAGQPLVEKLVKAGEECSNNGDMANSEQLQLSVCTHGRWQTIGTETHVATDKGVLYKGHCSVQFVEDGTRFVTLPVKLYEIADICLPAGWKATAMVKSRGQYWEYIDQSPRSNLVSLRAATMGNPAKLSIYSINENNTVIDKFEVVLETVAEPNGPKK
jgi:hypothetical protein